MELKIDSVDAAKTTKQGEVYYPVKADGKTYYVLGHVPMVGQTIDADVRESKYMWKGKETTSRWATFNGMVGPKAAPIQSNGGMPWAIIMKCAELAHSAAEIMEPDTGNGINAIFTDRSQARMAFVNTCIIALTGAHSKGIDFAEFAGDMANAPPPSDDSDVPF